MEEQGKRKKNITPYIMGFAIILLVAVLIIAISQGVLQSAQGIFLCGALVVLIVTGIMRIQKSLKPNGQPGVSTTSAPQSADNQPASGNGSAPVAPAAVSNNQTASATSTPAFVQKFDTWIKRYPRNTQIAIVAGGAVGIVLTLVLLISLVSGSLFAASPTGTWIQEGYEERVRYVFYENDTWEMYDHGVMSQSGTIEQTGSHVDLHLLYYYGNNYDEGYETAYYVIHGDRMTSGNVVLIRQTE